MIRYFCDRCGEDIGLGEKVSGLVVCDNLSPGVMVHLSPQGLYDITTDRYKRDEALELCAGCRGELHEWMKPIRRPSFVGAKP